MKLKKGKLNNFFYVLVIFGLSIFFMSCIDTIIETRDITKKELLRIERAKLIAPLLIQITGFICYFFGVAGELGIKFTVKQMTKASNIKKIFSALLSLNGVLIVFAITMFLGICKIVFEMEGMSGWAKTFLIGQVILFISAYSSISSRIKEDLTSIKTSSFFVNIVALFWKYLNFKNFNIVKFKKEIEESEEKAKPKRKRTTTSTTRKQKTKNKNNNTTNKSTSV